MKEEITTTKSQSIQENVLEKNNKRYLLTQIIKNRKNYIFYQQK